ncbi:MAG: PEP/pyruvate-binding domain-containing protein [Acidimicrobiia bacterium]
MTLTVLSQERVLYLDDPRSTDPRLTGAKASWLARGRQQGLSVLPGMVVTTGASDDAMAIGRQALGRRGSGAARLEIGRAPLPPDLMHDIAGLAGLGTLAVRSSSVLEGDGAWAGAFASYVDVSPDELALAISGCWASAFTVAALERFRAAGLEAGSMPMAVLVQRALRPDFGGVARLTRSGEVEVTAVQGMPAPLVQGWVSGWTALVDPAGEVTADDHGSALMPAAHLLDIGRQLQNASRLIGANTCEWAIEDGLLFMLQFANRPSPPAPARHRLPVEDRRLIPLTRLARRYPGQLGEALVLSWAAANPDLVINRTQTRTRSTISDTPTARARASQLAAALTAQTWGMPEALAAARAAAVLRQARGTNTKSALDCLAALNQPDPDLAVELVDLVEAAQLSGPNRTSGTDRWQPLQIAVLETFGHQHQGTAVSPGVGFGRFCFIGRPDQVGEFRPGDVVVVPQPVPNLAPLLWNATGLVAINGSPAAHLFESARSLNVPAVCAIDLSTGGDLPAATGWLAAVVDGDSGRVFIDQW